jgi:hypothetical protein
MRVENLSYNVNWKNFRVGYSIFIPCLNCAQAKKDIQQTTKRLKIDIITKITIEEGIRGLRIWRI